MVTSVQLRQDKYLLAQPVVSTSTGKHSSMRHVCMVHVLIVVQCWQHVCNMGTASCNKGVDDTVSQPMEIKAGLEASTLLLLKSVDKITADAKVSMEKDYEPKVGGWGVVRHESEPQGNYMVDESEGTEQALVGG